MSEAWPAASVLRCLTIRSETWPDAAACAFAVQTCSSRKPLPTPPPFEYPILYCVVAALAGALAGALAASLAAALGRRPWAPRSRPPTAPWWHRRPCCTRPR